MNTPRKEDKTAIQRFWQIIRGIDLTVYAHEDEKKDEDKKDEKEKDPILKTGDLFKAFDKKIEEISYEPKPFYDNSNHVSFATQQLLKIVMMSAMDTVHWNLKLVGGIAGVILSDLISEKSPLFLQFVLRIFDEIQDEHAYLRSFAIACFPRLLKRLSKALRGENTVEKKPEDFKNNKLSLDEAFDRHFLLKSDQEKYFLKDPYTGYLDNYETLEINVTENPKIEINKDFLKKVHDKEFLSKIILNMVNDIPTKEEVTTGPVGRAAFNFKTIIRYFFGKQSGSSAGGAGTDFNSTEAAFFTCLLRYFDGFTVFENSCELIKELASDFNSREKQMVAAHYIHGIIKASKFWSKDHSVKAQEYAATLLLRALENVSLDKVVVWISAFMCGVKRTDYRLVKPFLQSVLLNPFEKKSSSVQSRYLILHSAMVKEYGYHSKEIVDNLLNLVTNFKPADIRQASEISDILMCLPKFYLLAPLNYRKLVDENIVEGLEKMVEQNPQELIVVKGVHLYRINKKFIKIMENYVDWAKAAETPEEKKIYFETIFSYFVNFQFDKLSYPYYLYFRSILKFLIELNISETSLSPETIQSHEKYLINLSKLEYPEGAVSDILEIVKANLSSTNYRVRDNALKFFHYFSYNHLFYYKEAPFALIEEILVDENNNTRNKAFEVLTDLYKLIPLKDLSNIANDTKSRLTKAKTAKDVKEQTKSIYIMMALIQSCPYELEAWTEDLLVLILANKKVNKALGDKFNKEFVGQFWAAHKGQANINERALSYDVYSDLREIANPSSYFA